MPPLNPHQFQLHRYTADRFVDPVNRVSQSDIDMEQALHPAHLDPGLDTDFVRRVPVHPERGTEGPAELQRTRPGKFMLNEKSGTEPIRNVYRGVSEDEWKQAGERGYIQSDKRGVISQDEGTNAGVEPETARSYLPPQQAGRIVKINVRPEHHWFTINPDSYIRTRERIPLRDVSAVTPVMRKGGKYDTIMQRKDIPDSQVRSVKH